MGFGIDEDYSDYDEEEYTSGWNLLAEGKWETQYEGIIAFRDMKKSHLNNTIRMIRRHLHDGTYDEEGIEKIRLRTAQLEALEQEQRIRS